MGMRISQIPTDKRFKDLRGQVFGRLKVISFWGSNKHRKSYWNCVCECGNEVEAIALSSLTRGTTQSCGCLQKERAAKAQFKHGLSYHPLKLMWENMHQRCYNPKNSHFQWYGAKGIEVCNEWNRSNPNGLENFINFIETKMQKPSEEKTKGGVSIWSIDRINRSKNYEPSNVRWATWHEQAVNRSEGAFIRNRTSDGRFSRF